MRSDPRAGFTLIEVLAGLFLTGLFIIIVLPFFTQLVGRAWSGEANMLTADQWMQASARLAADFGEAVPLSIGDGSQGLAFHASSHRIEFVRRAISGDRNHLEIVTISIESDADTQTILRSTRPYSKDAFSGDDDSDSDEGGSQIALLTTSYDLHFKTHGGEKSKLPSEVELDVDGDGSLSDIPFVFPIVARTSPATAAGPPNQGMP